jgi:hypothetical protein
MKTAKLALIIVGCTAIPAFAQDGSLQCEVTNFDRNRGLFTITNPDPRSLNQQCFLTVVSKDEWSGGLPDFSSSQLVEGNYEISASGGGGGGGGAAPESRGYDGADAIPFKHTRYLSPGVYRLTIGSGGQGGPGCVTEDRGGRGGDGAPTSLSEAYSGQTIAGYPRAESWDGTYPQSYRVASGRRAPGDGAAADGNMTPAARSGELGGGGRGASGTGSCEVGTQGGNGFIRLAFADPVPQARAAAATDQAAPTVAPAERSVTTPAPAATRPARRDRN